MRLSPSPKAARFAALLLLAGVAAKSSHAAKKSPPPKSPTRTVALIPYNDPSPVARQRYRDIDGRPYSEEFSSAFRYNANQVKLTYQTMLDKPFFMGHIEAHNLKPNFSYQLKLVGKPVDGRRGWGAFGDDKANEAIGRETRWWNDSNQVNSTDQDYFTNYGNAATNLRQTIYGYDYMGEFVTDAQGNADLDFTGEFAYHVSWQDKQKGDHDKFFGDFIIGNVTAPYYGYGKSTPLEKVRLWYQWESDRSHKVRLPAGTYNCRFLITEETFHSVDPDEGGGTWPTVLCSEDFDSDGKPDSDPSNDIFFTIR